MKTLLFSTILASLCVTVLTSGLSSVSAQTTRNTFEGRAATDTRDEYLPGAASSGGGLDFTSIIHNTNLANSRSMGQFRKEQDQNMSDQVEKFRNRQPIQIKGIGGKVEATSPAAVETTPASKEVIKTP
jgi:hypothetical protein